MSAFPSNHALSWYEKIQKLLTLDQGIRKINEFALENVKTENWRKL